MAKKIEVVAAIDERKAVRGIYNTAHCRSIKNRKGFFVFYIDEFNDKKIIGHDDNTRADAWRNAFDLSIGNKMVKKLEE